LADEGASNMTRKVLTILSNRFTPTKTPIYLELECKSDGTILKEKKLRSLPRQAAYDEVWENNDGKSSLDSCTRMKKHYRHKLLKPKSVS
jgi:hypothetical protein